jgi:hypothetical protein
MVPGIRELRLSVRAGQETCADKRKAQTRRKTTNRIKLHVNAPFLFNLSQVSENGLDYAARYVVGRQFDDRLANGAIFLYPSQPLRGAVA